MGGMSDAWPTRRVFFGAALAGTATLAVAGSFPSRPARPSCPPATDTAAVPDRRRPADPAAGDPTAGDPTADPAAGDVWWRGPFRC